MSFSPCEVTKLKKKVTCICKHSVQVVDKRKNNSAEAKQNLSRWYECKNGSSTDFSVNPKQTVRMFLFDCGNYESLRKFCYKVAMKVCQP